MSSKLNCFWYRENPKFHVISHEVSEKKYFFYCGETGESGDIGTVKQALEKKLNLCGECIMRMPLEEVRKLTQHF